MTQSISMVIATKDRPADLSRLLDSLSQQTVRPAEIVIVDASRQPVESVTTAFPELRLRYLRHWPPSASAQRNAGVSACDPTATLIGFLDDDTIFEPEAFANMIRFWECAIPEVLGAAFNIRNYPLRRGQYLKNSGLAESLGLYSRTPGTVSPSGWHSVIAELVQTQFVEWLPSGAVVWRREVFKERLFDEFFESYSYLEDLDFSYALGRKGRLAVVANAGFFHFPSSEGRVSHRQFGLVEVRNRLYFVRKHHLSASRCYIGILIRLTMTVFTAVVHLDRKMLSRAYGNVQALLKLA